MKNNSLTRILIATLCLLSVHAARAAEDVFSTEDRRQELIASRWIESFSLLDTRNNITMVLVGYDKLYELNGVVSVTSNKRFIVVKYKGDGGKDFKALVYPSSILVVKEGP